MQCGQFRQSSGAQNISAERYIILLKELSYILQNFLSGQMTKHCIIIVGIDGSMLVLQVARAGLHVEEYAWVLTMKN